MIFDVIQSTIGQETSNLNIDLIPSGQESDLLFYPKPNDICRKLDAGFKVNVAYSVRPTIRYGNAQQKVSVTAKLGAISIDWSPISLQHSRDDKQITHGPLQLEQTSPFKQKFKQKGPVCYVEETPFDASFETVPAMPKVGNPFQVKYEITNKTGLHQRLRVLMNDSETIVSSNSMLVSGVINGEIVLGPSEKKVLSYSILVTKVGKIAIPAFDVSSLRYNTWVVKGSTLDKVFVSP